MVVSDDRSGVGVMLHGDLYGPAADPIDLLNRYLLEGESLFELLNGSFAVLVVDPRADRVLVVSDRFGSRKIFASEGEGGWWLSSTLDRHPTAEHRLSPAGIGSLLSSGAAHADLTPFEGIRKLDPGSVHEFSPGGQTAVRYWGFQASNTEVGRSPSDLRKQMVQVMRAAVERRLERSGELFISLSGGGDSRTVAGLLSELVVDRKQVRAFTYHHGRPVGDTDVRVAGMVADELGFGHEVVEAYRGDLMAVIAANSASGQGIANFCHETDAWAAVGPAMASSSDNVLFVAEIIGVVKTPKGGTPESVLAEMDSYPISIIDYFLDYLDDDVSQAVRDGWGHHYRQLSMRAASHADIRAAYEDLRLGQRLPNRLMPWREFFQMPYVKVANPLLDNDVVDLTLALPVELRERKALYRQALAEAFPRLASIPVTSGGWNNPDWAKEVRNNAKPIKELLQRSSRLDELIPPEAIAQLLDTGMRSASTGRDNMTRRLKAVVKQSAPLRRIVRAAKPKVQPAVRRKRPWERLMLDLLSLRGFLSKDG
jgi:asparagine synthase (glutamine-hydrolysing)